jgi:Protein of unknown function (DUF4230)
MATMLDERPTRAGDNGAAHEVVVRVVGDGGGNHNGGSAPPRRRWSLRGIGIFAGLGALAVAVILLANAIGGLFDFQLFGTTKIDRSAPVVLKQLRDVSTYTAATGEFEATVDVETDTFLPTFLMGERAIFVGVGTVDAQVDFGALTKDAIVVGPDGAVTVTLPQPTLGKAHVDPSRSHVANRDRGLLNRIEGMFKDNPTSEQELYLKAQHRMAQAARGSEMRARAERNTETMLKGLLGKLGFERVTVVWTGTAHDPGTL